MHDPQEVRWLLQDKYHWPEAQIRQVLAGGKELSASLPNEIQEDIHRLENGEPLAYVIGWVEFLDCRIDLSLHPLIPRPETEYWVEQFLRERQEARKGTQPGEELRVLDLCCGSGCIGLAVLKHLPDVSLTFVDVDPQMLAQTEKNAVLNGIPGDRYQCIASDLFSGVSGQFDVILANPPYVNPFGSFSPTLAYEPKRAIFAQKEGFEVIEKIIFQAKEHLKIEGEMWLEFAHDQAERVQEAARQEGWEIRVSHDQFGRDRYAVLCSKEAGETK